MRITIEEMKMVLYTHIITPLITFITFHIALNGNLKSLCVYTVNGNGVVIYRMKYLEEILIFSSINYD